MKHRLAVASACVMAFIGSGWQAQTPARKPAPPSPAPPPAVEGVVRGPDGKAVPEALVIARSSLDDASAPPLTTHSDANGAFRLTVKDGGLHTVRVEARGLAGVTLERVRPGSPLSVTLAKGVAIQGTVRDASSGQPVAGARVEARDTKSITLVWEPDVGAASALTDEQGRYRIEGLGSGLHSVSTAVRGYGAARKTDVKVGSAGVDLYLFPGASISGIVRAPGGEPVAAAIVRAEGEMTRGAAPKPAVTARDGRFEIAGLEPGPYRLVTRHRDFAPGVGARVSLERDSALVEDVVLERGGSVVGRLTDGEGRPVAGRVSASELSGQSLPRALADLFRAETGLDGRFRLGPFPEGDHALSVAASGYATKRVDARLARGEAEADVGDVALESGLTIRGRVRDRGGAAVAGATLMAYSSRGPTATGIMLSIEARSESDGSFSIGGLQPGSYRVGARAPGYGQLDRTLEAGERSAELVLTPAGAITGQAVDDEGKPVEVFRVSSRSVAAGTAGGPGPGRTQDFTSADGRFALEDVGEGTHVLSVSAPERVAASVSGVKVVGGTASDVGRIKLSAGGIVRGSVVEPTGAPIAGASVTARGAGRDFSTFATQAVSDGAGSFEIRGAPLGLVELTATHPNYADGRVPGIEVDPAKGPAEARIVLGQGGRVEGFVRRRDGRGLPGAAVNVAPIRRDGGITFSSQGLIPTRDDGYYVAEHVPAGRARVFLMIAAMGGMYTNAQDREVEVRDGVVIGVDFVSQDILVSGRLTRAGAPAAGVRVNLRSQQGVTMMMGVGGAPTPVAGPQRNTALTRDDGGYEMLVSVAGTAVVTVERPDGKGSLPSREVTIPDADAHTLDLDFSGVSVAGVVVDEDTEAPLAEVNVFASPKRPATGMGAGSVSTLSGADGRFTLELEPAAYRVSARKSEGDYTSSGIDVDAGSAAPEIRLALKRGGAIAGRLLDTAGRGVANAVVNAVGGEAPQLSAGGAQTLPDGSFRIGGLRQAPHSLLGRSDLGGFAVRTGVMPGEQEVTLTLRPAGRLQVRVLGPDQKPVEGVRVFVSRYRGSLISGISSNATDAQGAVELLVPAGSLELTARKDKLEAKASASVAEGGAAPLQMVLAPVQERNP